MTKSKIFYKNQLQQKVIENFNLNCSAYTASVNKPENLEEKGGFYQGDIMNPPELRPNSKNGLIDESYRWPNGIVPYTIIGEFSKNNLTGKSPGRLISLSLPFSS